MNAVIEQEPQTAYESLNRREQRFVDAFVGGETAAAALRQSKVAGNNSTQGRVYAHRLLKKQHIRDAVKERTIIAVHDAGAHTVAVMRNMAAMATSDVRKIFNADGSVKRPDELDEATALAIKSIDVEQISTEGLQGTRYKYQFWDKAKAGEFIGKSIGLLQPATINVDARTVTVNHSTNGAEAVQGAVRLLEQIRSQGFSSSATVSDQDRPVLSIAVRDESKGHRAPLDVGADQGGAE